MGNKGEGLSERFLNYAVKIVLFVERLEKSFVGRHIGSSCSGQELPRDRITKKRAARRAARISYIN